MKERDLKEKIISFDNFKIYIPSGETKKLKYYDFSFGRKISGMEIFFPESGKKKFLFFSILRNEFNE